jgi:uncharacterized membrane protein
MSSPQKSGVSDNVIAAIAYFSPIPAFFFLSVRHYNKRLYVRFHSWQSLVLSAFLFLIGLALDFRPPLYELPRAARPADSFLPRMPGRLLLMAVVRHSGLERQAPQATADWHLGR